MAKRSPILGYNHNVKYRGLVFHVQTEDSGLLNPHLFTHLFHEGVIVSTRKLVYDAGANEEAIKALMQAQHKAVMKDLRKGAFDDKIDQYLSGVPGLEPRVGGDGKPVPSAASAAAEPGSPTPPPVAAAAPPPEPTAATSISEGSPIEIVDAGLSEPIELPIKPRTQTAERTSRHAPRHPPPPPPEEENAPTLMGSTAGDVAAAIRAANAQGSGRDSGLEIDLGLDDDHAGRSRGPRDTTVEPLSEGVPSRIAGADSAPMTTPVRQRPPSHGAATLPAMKKSTPRPIQPVVTRPPAGDRRNDESAPVEIYAPAPPSVEPPPGERAERAGQYSVSRKDGGAPIREKTGRLDAINPTSIPAGLGRPARDKGTGSSPAIPSHRQPAAREDSGANRGVPQNVQREPTPQAAREQGTPRPGAVPPRPPTMPGGSRGVPQPPPSPRGAVQVTAPIVNRTPSPATPPSGSGVVMARPAVIVGAPPKPPQGAQQRVRKAREDEGRGFGQGLISEKSLDEVILAYLSEDAEDK